MERNNGSYPDPTAERSENGAHPFYTHTQRSLEPSDDVGNNLAQLTREIASDQNEPSHAMNHHGLPMVADQSRPQVTLPHQQHATYPDNMMPPQASYAHMHPQQPHHQMAAEANMVPTPSAPQSVDQRKKPKVTRACDECRRKKIRCEFKNEPTGPEGTVANSSERCSNCTRTNSVCEFSRQPQKRGPSKGYIKELADRLHSVEQKVGGSDGHLGLSESPPVRSEDYPRGLPYDVSRKRHRDSHPLEPLTGITPNYGASEHYAQGAWGSPRQAESSSAYPLYSPQGFSHSHYGEPPSARRETFPQGDSPAFKRRRENSDYSPEMAFYGEEPMQLDDNLFNLYRNQVYPTYPILVCSKPALQEFLARISSNVLCQAFLRALKIASSHRILNAMATPVHDHVTTSIYNMINDPNLPGMLQRDVESKLITLQTILLMLVHMDANGPRTINGTSSSPRGAWLGMANDLAQDMKLFELGGAKNVAQLEMQPDDMKAVGQRCWWSLVVMDKWHAAGTATAPQIPEAIIRLGLINYKILGRGLFNLTRLTLSFGSIADAFCSPFPITFEHTTHDSVFTRALDKYLSQTGTTILETDVRQMTIPHLAYWHVKLLLARHTQASPTHVHDIVSYASNIRKVVLSYPAAVGFLGPLAHHAYILCALTLSDVVDVKEHREEALDITRGMLSALEPYRVGEPEALKDHGLCWGNAVVGILRGILERGGREEPDGLQQLAEMAVGEEGKVEREKDWGAVGRKGYLTLV